MSRTALASVCTIRDPEVVHYKPIASVDPSDLDFLIPTDCDTYIDTDIKHYVRGKLSVREMQNARNNLTVPYRGKGS